MPRRVEPLNGGLNNGEDPAFLRPGQLADMRNCIYLPGGQALQRARGRTAFGQVSASAVGSAINGLRDITFDNGNAYLIAMSSGAYSSAAVGDTGTFGAITVTSTNYGSQLEAIHYRNRFYLLNGVSADASSTGTNLTLYLTATAISNLITARQMGMLPVIAAPFVTASASAFSQTVTGYYEYWTTEVAKITQDGAILTLESAFNSNTGPTTVFVSSTGMAPIIQMPAIVNPITTHWRIYRSPKKDSAKDKKFPTGFMISELGTATAVSANFVVDTSSLVSAAGTASNANTSAPFADFSNAVTGASAVGGASAAASGTSLTTVSQAWYGFNFGGFKGPVKGIQLEVGAKVTGTPGTVPLTMTIGKRAVDGNFTTVSVPAGFGGITVQVPKTASKSANITATAVQVLSYGASADRWFSSDQAALVDSDFDSNFMVRASFHANAQVAIDYIFASAWYGGPVDGTIQYPAVVYTFGDITTQVSKNFPPPNASTGDVFEDALVVNDVSNPSVIRWSFPGDPESFPPTYYLDFETRENDQVRLIRVVNSILIVALDASVWAINYLPSERDSSFDRGKAMRAISKTYGCFGPMCATTFSPDGGPEILAFVSDTGIHGTDGRSFTTYTSDLDWRTIISTTSTSNPIALINDRERQELLFYYRNDALANETYMCLHLNYAPEHMNRGMLKISGPVHMRNFNSSGSLRASLESAWTVQRSTGATDVYLGYGGTATGASAGFVLRETGTTIPAEDQTMRYVTRRMYQNGLGNEWVGREVYGYCGSYNNSPIITYTAQNTKTGDSGPATVYSKTVTLRGQKLHKVEPRFKFEGAQITAQITASAFAQHSLIIEGEEFGVEDAGT